MGTLGTCGSLRARRWRPDFWSQGPETSNAQLHFWHPPPPNIPSHPQVVEYCDLGNLTHAIRSGVFAGGGPNALALMRLEAASHPGTLSGGGAAGAAAAAAAAFGMPFVGTLERTVFTTSACESASDGDACACGSRPGTGGSGGDSGGGDGGGGGGGAVTAGGLLGPRPRTGGSASSRAPAAAAAPPPAGPGPPSGLTFSSAASDPGGALLARNGGSGAAAAAAAAAALAVGAGAAPPQPPRVQLTTLLLTLLEVAGGMAYLHRMGVVHCDLKPANVLLKSSSVDRRGFTAKISDFGLSRCEVPAPGTRPARAPRPRRDGVQPGPQLNSCSIRPQPNLLNPPPPLSFPFQGRRRCQLRHLPLQQLRHRGVRRARGARQHEKGAARGAGLRAGRGARWGALRQGPAWAVGWGLVSGHRGSRAVPIL
jgi:hypothetical protein